MGLNITHTNSFQFENRNNMKNAAKDILKRQGESSQAADKFVEKVFINNKQTNDFQFAVVKASYDLNVNESLKETLDYLKKHAHKKAEKEPVLGEIWNLFSGSEAKDYDGELANFIIDDNAKNIFAA